MTGLSFWMTEDISKIVGVAEATVRRWCRQDLFNAKLIGYKVWIIEIDEKAHDTIARKKTELLKRRSK